MSKWGLVEVFVLCKKEAGDQINMCQRRLSKVAGPGTSEVNEEGRAGGGNTETRQGNRGSRTLPSPTGLQ